MILTSLKGEKQSLSARRVMEVKSAPDTIVVMSNGSCLPVKESLEDVLGLFLKERSRKPQTLFAAGAPS